VEFDDLEAEGITLLEKMVSDGVEETHRLEFKQKRDPNDVELHKDDRRALGEALSGFANATGGLLVVGVKTDRKTGVDRAAELLLMPDVDQVVDRYRSYLNDCVSPPIGGLRISTVKRADGSGAIIIDVPQGNARPHMSMAPNHQRYYRRVADSFIPMLHYEIDEMMRLKASPQLELILAYQSGGSIGGNPKNFLAFGLKNISKATAKYPYIFVRSSLAGPRLSDYGLDGNGPTLWSRLVQGVAGEATFAAGADMVIHPNQSFLVSRFEYLHKLDERMQYWSADSLHESQVVRFEFTFGCEDAPATTKFVEFAKTHLLNLEMPVF
jgi:hypothetical protein